MGIFAPAATMGSVAGPAVILALIFLGIVVILLALPYAELGHSIVAPCPRGEAGTGVDW